jgi:hypothetical protein
VAVEWDVHRLRKPACRVPGTSRRATLRVSGGVAERRRRRPLHRSRRRCTCQAVLSLSVVARLSMVWEGGYPNLRAHLPPIGPEAVEGRRMTPTAGGSRLVDIGP